MSVLPNPVRRVADRPILYFYPGGASLPPHIVLEEIGTEYDLGLVDRIAGAQRHPEYLKLNPNGLLPVFVDGDFIMYESAAICLHLAERAPEANLIPPVGTAERSRLYQWLVWMTNSVQPPYKMFFLPDQFASEGVAASDIKSSDAARLLPLIDILENHVATAGGPWMMGEQYSILDPFAFMLLRWSGTLSKPAAARPALREFMLRMVDRPAVSRVMESENLPKPWVSPAPAEVAAT